jgi:hypothetical protein|tara:strand:+ start:5901 stop:7070 length:1170 start_codon:yes stop_codon:yes gene_type:complete
MAKCDITPISAFQSTNLNSKIDNFNRLSDRILRSLGYPFINVEIHRDTLYENISISCEMFAKFAGYTQEYLLFDSNLYIKNQGIRLDHLFSLQSSDSLQQQVEFNNESKDFSNYIQENETLYVANSAIPGTYFSTISALSASLEDGTFANQIFSEDVYSVITDSSSTILSGLSTYFTPSYKQNFTTEGTITGKREKFMNSFDYDMLDYRKVIAVQDFEEGSSTGINTLFTIEQSMAQQTYFSYAMGNYGFDLVSWYVLKDWMEMREKLLATKRSYTFDDRTQMLRMYPQPRSGGSSAARFYGVVSCYIERPIRDIIKEHWVYQYSLALTKIAVANIRGKYGSVTLFGGGSLNSSDLMTQGLAEKEKLETALYEGAPGLGDAEPPMFFVG